MAIYYNIFVVIFYEGNVFMNWTEIIAEVDAKDVDLAGSIAQMTVPYGIYIEDYSNLEEEVLQI